MALPENRIKKIKLPNNTEYTIVPEQLQNNEHSLSVPTLNADDEIITKKINQNITGAKTFSSSLTADGDIRTDNLSLLFKVYDDVDATEDRDVLRLINQFDDDGNFIGSSVTASGHFIAFGDDDNDNENKPDSELIDTGDIDTDYFNTGITLRDLDNNTSYKISFPAKSGVFATTDDITDVEIVDLTDLEHASYKLSLYENDETTYLRVNFSQGYVLDYIEMTNTVDSSSFYVNMLYDSGDYVIDEVDNCSVDGYSMTNKTTGGLQNSIVIELNEVPAQLSDLEMIQIDFLKVEGTFDFQL